MHQRYVVTGEGLADMFTVDMYVPTPRIKRRPKHFEVMERCSLDIYLAPKQHGTTRHIRKPTLLMMI